MLRLVQHLKSSPNGADLVVIELLKQFFDQRLSLQGWFAQVLSMPIDFALIMDMFIEFGANPQFILYMAYGPLPIYPVTAQLVPVHPQIAYKKPSKNRTKNPIKRSRTKPNSWTASETARLADLVEKMDGHSWVAIAQALGTGKTGGQCSQHWTRVAAPHIRKGSWLAEEEAKLLNLRKLYVNHWSRMAKELPGRTDIQCRHHWQALSHSAQFPWKREEDDILMEGVAEHGTGQQAWSLISAQLGKRRAPQLTTRWPVCCMERYYQLTNEQEP